MITQSMTDIEATLRAEMVMCGRLLYERGLIVAGDGNLSARLPDGSILMTPAGLAKGMLTVDDLVVVDNEGRLVRGAPGRQPSSERYLHLFVLARRPDVMACIHAHPPTAVGATLAGVSLAEPLLPEALIALGPPTMALSPMAQRSCKPFTEWSRLSIARVCCWPPTCSGARARCPQNGWQN